MDNSDLSSSLEDYLEAILQLVRESSVARVKDIAEIMHVKRSSVTIALRNLAERSLINYSPYSVITLTPEGEALAQCVSRKHSVLKDLFITLLGVDVAQADSVACKVEHGLEPEVFQRLSALLRLCKNDKDLLTKLKDGLEREVANTKVPCGTAHGCCSGGEHDDSPLLVSLASCDDGSKGILRKILSSGTGKQRLLDMGFVLGAPVTLIRHNDKNDTFEVQVKNYQLPLRIEDARRLLIETA